MREVFVGIDLGGTNIKIGCFDKSLQLLAKTSIPSHVERDPESIVDRICQSVEQMLTGCGRGVRDIVAAGIGSPGLIDIEAGVVIASSNMMFKNVPMTDMLGKRLGAEAVLENDANITCWAEHAAGAGRGINEMVLFTLGTGIGGGIITSGELVHGYCNCAAELGHVIIFPGGRTCGCGQKGCIEAYASASATAARATEAILAGQNSSLKKLLDENEQITSKDVYEHVASGDRLAREITDGTAKAIAILCINMVHTTDPELIVMFGGMIGAGELLLAPIRKFFDEHIWSLKKEEVRICFSQLGDDAGIIGAAALAQHLKG